MLDETDNQLSLLTRALAALLEWKDLREITYWCEDYFDTYEIKALVGIPPNHSDETLVPDWPSDIGAAFLLCSDIGTQHNYEMCTYTSHGITTATFQNASTDEYVIHANGTTPALAMARLALRILNKKD
jgi:hypothetical protein